MDKEQQQNDRAGLVACGFILALAGLFCYAIDSAVEQAKEKEQAVKVAREAKIADHMRRVNEALEACATLRHQAYEAWIADLYRTNGRIGAAAGKKRIDAACVYEEALQRVTYTND